MKKLLCVLLLLLLLIPLHASAVWYGLSASELKQQMSTAAAAWSEPSELRTLSKPEMIFVIDSRNGDTIGSVSLSGKKIELALNSETYFSRVLGPLLQVISPQTDLQQALAVISQARSSGEAALDLDGITFSAKYSSQYGQVLTMELTQAAEPAPTTEAATPTGPRAQDLHFTFTAQQFVDEFTAKLDDTYPLHKAKVGTYTENGQTCFVLNVWNRDSGDLEARVAFWDADRGALTTDQLETGEVCYVRLVVADPVDGSWLTDAIMGIIDPSLTHSEIFSAKMDFLDTYDNGKVTKLVINQILYEARPAETLLGKDQPTRLTVSVDSAIS